MPRSRLVLHTPLAAPAACLLLLACGGGGSTPVQAPPVTLSLTGATTPLTVLRTRTITAIVGNSSNQQVTWSVESGGGSITQAGVFTAPDTPSRVAIRATAAADPGKSATLAFEVVAEARITSFTASRNPVYPGDRVSLTAAFTGGTAAVTPDVGAVTSGQAFSVDPRATKDYTLTVTNPAGDAATRTLTVTYVDQAPSIASFTAMPAVVPYGDPVALQWTLGGGAPATVTVNDAPVTGDGLAVLPDTRARYTLAVTNPLGGANRTVQAAAMGLTAFAGSVWGGPGWADGMPSQVRTKKVVAMCRAQDGRVWFTDDQVLRVRDKNGVITTVAGKAGAYESVDGSLAEARFRDPAGLWVAGPGTASTLGDTVSGDSTLIYIAESSAHAIRCVNLSTGTVSTIAGASGQAGSADGPGFQARFNRPSGLALGPNGQLYVADEGNHTVRRLEWNAGSARWEVHTLAGSAGTPGFADGAPGTARFRSPCALAVDATGHLYVADHYNHAIRWISPEGQVATMGGNGEATCQDGTGAEARYDSPKGIALTQAGGQPPVIYVAEGSGTVRQLTFSSAGWRTTTLAGIPGEDGFRDGEAAQALLDNDIQGLAPDHEGGLLVGGRDGLLRRIHEGQVATVAGQPQEPGALNGSAVSARFRGIFSGALLPDGSLVVVDTSNHALRRIAQDGRVSTLAGKLGERGYAEGAGAEARFDGPEDVTLDTNGDLLVSDTGNRVVRRVTVAGRTSLLAGRPGVGEIVDGNRTVASFGTPRSLLRWQGRLLVADRSTLRQVAQDGSISTLAGSPTSGFANGTGAAARFGSTLGKLVAAPWDGEFLVADIFNHVVRKVNVAGQVATFAGQPGTGGAQDGPLASATLRLPLGLAVGAGPESAVYVSGMNGHLRRITSQGMVSTVAGDPESTEAMAPGRLPGTLWQTLGLIPYGPDLLVCVPTGLVRVTAPEGH